MCERATSYLRDRAAQSEHQITTNIDRDNAWRGQALGELQTRHRREAEEKLGARNLSAMALVSSLAGLVLTVDTKTL